MGGDCPMLRSVERSIDWIVSFNMVFIWSIVIKLIIHGVLLACK